MHPTPPPRTHHIMPSRHNTPPTHTHYSKTFGCQHHILTHRHHPSCHGPYHTHSCHTGMTPIRKMPHARDYTASRCGPQRIEGVFSLSSKGRNVMLCVMCSARRSAVLTSAAFKQPPALLGAPVHQERLYYFHISLITAHTARSARTQIHYRDAWSVRAQYLSSLSARKSTPPVSPPAVLSFSPPSLRNPSYYPPVIFWLQLYP